MIDYPKQDQQIMICTADNAILTGMVNITGRNISTYIQECDPHVILYDVELADKQKFDTLIVTTRQIIWIAVVYESEKDWFGNWQKLSFKMINGQTVIGKVDITGYDRVSDFFQRFPNMFYQLFGCSIDGEKRDVLFVSSRFTVWKKPVVRGHKKEAINGCIRQTV